MGSNEKSKVEEERRENAQETHGNREFADLSLLICNIRSRCFDILAEHILSLCSGSTSLAVKCNVERRGRVPSRQSSGIYAIEDERHTRACRARAQWQENDWSEELTYGRQQR